MDSGIMQSFERRGILDFRARANLVPKGHQYEFVMNLGSGMMGKVFFFKEVNDGSLKAVKIVPYIIIVLRKEESSAYKTLESECDNLERLKHEDQYNGSG